MKRACLPVLMFALLSVPATSFAQTEDAAPAVAEVVEEGADVKAAPVKPESSEEDGAPKVEGEPAAATDAVPPAATDATPAAADATPAAGPKVGPGGRPLRTDYPAKDDALKSQMQTDGVVATGDGMEKSKVYDTRIQELERRIDDMKEGVFRSKSRIVLLRETLLGGRNAGSKAVIVHKSEINDDFKLSRALYRLDGNSLLNELDQEGSLNKEEIKLYDGSLGAGTHKLNVSLDYEGKSSVFSYFKGYKFNLPTTCNFSVMQGQVTRVEVVVYEGGNVTTKKEDRPRIKCNVSTTPLTQKDIVKPKK